MAFDPSKDPVTDIGAHYLDEALRAFRGHKRMAEAAMAQVSDEQFFSQLDPEANSIAIIAKHIAGNQRSRWTDFLSSDGEKPNRHRDTEFEMTPSTTRDEVLRWWKDGWARLFAAVEPLKSEDLKRVVTIRGQAHTVLMAINRQLLHYAQHIGQIVLLAKHLRGAEWQTLSIPRGMSEQVGRAAEAEHRKRQQ